MDIKLENLVITNEWILKIIDYGYVKTIRNNTGLLIKHYSYLGTEGYTSPEVLQKDYFCDKTDVFSAGVVLFSMLVGKSPFFNATKEDFYYSLFINKNYDEYFCKILKNNLLDADAKDLIIRMFSYNPSERIDLKSVLEHKFLKDEIASVEEVKKYFI